MAYADARVLRGLVGGGLSAAAYGVVLCGDDARSGRRGRALRETR